MPINRKLTLYESALEILPYAIKFYGDKYKNVVEDTLNNAKLYEWHDETKSEMIKKILGIDCEVDEKKAYTLGFYYYDKEARNGCNHIIAVRKVYELDKIKEVLAHELFGHAVLSEKCPYLKTESGIIYKRNGLALMSNSKNDSHNIVINEGFAEYISASIMKLYNGDTKLPLLPYNILLSFALANAMFDCCDKEKLLDFLIYNKGNISEIYDSTNLAEWQTICEELTKEEPVISPYIMKLRNRKGGLYE